MALSSQINAIKWRSLILTSYVIMICQRVSKLTRVQLAQIQQIGGLKEKIVAILKEKHGGHQKSI